jgi:uncharacterized damage-inducible protein DinB
MEISGPLSVVKENHIIRGSADGYSEVDMGLADAFLKELDQEGKTTRRVLERVPADQLGWRPHAKSMSLGVLALHVAQVPGAIASWALEDTTNFSGTPPQAQAESISQVLTAHDASMTKTKEVLGTLGDAGLQRSWQGMAGEAPLMSMPKVALFRSIVLNHWYHHRGQLSVYLRLLDIPVPSIYGPSADENPFAART